MSPFKIKNTTLNMKQKVDFISFIIILLGTLDNGNSKDFSQIYFLLS